MTSKERLSLIIDNPTPHVLPDGDNAAPLEVIGCTATDKLVIIMVGMPASGKTYIAKRLGRYLTFFHDIPSQIFNVSDYRRQICGEYVPASFYDNENVEALAQRTLACDTALQDMIEYLRQDGVRVAVYDATNSKATRRKEIKSTLTNSGVGMKVMFIESICDDDKLLEENIRKVKTSAPDYRGMNDEEADEDYQMRRSKYESVYDTLSEDEGNYVKMINYNKIIVKNIRGYLPLKVVHFCMNLHTSKRTFYLTRHGQSEYNLVGKIGGDSSLTPAGQEYARRLATFASETIATKTEILSDGTEVKTEVPGRLWTSTLKRTKETAQYISHKNITHKWDNNDVCDWVQFRPMARRNLDELFAGAFDGMSYKQIQDRFPDEFRRRQKDKLAYRYPRGESYMDVTLRLEPLAHELERIREPLLMIGHQGILRIIYAYFMGLNRDEAPYVSIPLNTVIQLTPHAYGCEEKRFCLMERAEMLKDGQDEPPTSMPVFEEKNSDPQRHFSYDHNDPIMNAPSC